MDLVALKFVWCSNDSISDLFSPFGQQIRPMIEQMMSQMHGSRHVGPTTPNNSGSGQVGAQTAAPHNNSTNSKPSQSQPSEKNKSDFRHDDDDLD